jgi:maleylacetate reductase
MVPSFEFHALPWNIVFGAGAIDRLPAEIAKFGFQRALVLCTPGRRDQGEQILKLLGTGGAGLFDGARMHVPTETVTLALEAAAQCAADCSVSIGGGSTTGLGKALALQAGLPQIAIPTTYAGSEMTPIWGRTESGRKMTGRDPRVLPVLAIYDPHLTLGLPQDVRAASGMNALAQAVANVATHDAHPIAELYGMQAIRMLAHYLPESAARPGDVDALSGAMLGACLAGAALAVGRAGLHHRLCHVLGGAFDLPHAQTHAVLLPYTVAFNAASVPAGTHRVAECLGVDDAARGLLELAVRLRAPRTLGELGLREADLERAVALALENPIDSAEPPTPEGILTLLRNALEGTGMA